MPENASTEPLAGNGVAPPAAQSPGADAPSTDAARQPDPAGPVAGPPAKEIGGRDGPDPTRYGDWEKNGRCIDF